MSGLRDYDQDAILKNLNQSVYERVQQEIVDLIPKGEHRILEVGCSLGHTLVELKNSGRAKEIVGIEMNKAAAECARNYLDRLIEVNVEEVGPELFQESYFDYIIFSDILEHLVDPWATLEKMRRFLKNDGKLIALIVNLRYKSVILPLFLRGEFPYDPKGGVIDKAHLRFFTRKSAVSLFSESGFKRIAFFDRPLSLKGKLFSLFSFGFLKDFFTYRFAVVAQK